MSGEIGNRVIGLAAMGGSGTEIEAAVDHLEGEVGKGHPKRIG